MFRRRLVLLACVAMVCSWPASAVAQDPPTADPPAHISFVEGSALLERDGQTDTSPSSMPLLAGDRVRTQGGRVEILFADGSALHLDANTVIDVQSDEVVRLLDGRMRLSIAGPAREVSYRVDAPSAWVQIVEPGEYRVSLLRGEREPQVELAVVRGTAELVNEDGRSALRAGERAFARAGAAPSAPYVYNSAAWDAFDRWSESRRDQRLGVSAQYLPEDVRPYAATLDHYGSWRYEQVHGYVWYPRVSVGWRPYYYGRWASLRPYGWTWIAADPWGWPTHHYGRWGFSAGAWFWIPGRHWGPAYVSWGYAPDYVSWCPLGWNNRPVFSLVNINLFGGRRHYDPWHAWTVLPRHHFGRSRFVNVHVNVIAGARLDRRTWSSFSLSHSAPDARFAMPRAAAPIRWAGRRTGGIAVPRGSAGGFGSEAISGSDASRGSSEARAFPAPARAPRTGSGGERVPDQRATVGAPPDRSGVRRAVPRDGRDTVGSSPDPGVRSQRTPGTPRGEFNNVPSARLPQDRGVLSAPAAGDVTPGVRAVPRRERRSDGGSLPGVRSDADGRAPVQPERTYRGVPRTYGSDAAPQYRAPEYRSAPEMRRAPESRSAPDVRSPEFRRMPEPRRAPDPSPDRGMRSMPRGETSRPSYGPAPERRSPSRPQGTSAPSPSRRGGESASPQGRPRGGPSQGTATRRPRG